MRTAPVGSGLLGLLFILGSIFAPSLHAQDGEQEQRERVISGIIGAMLDREHFSPREFDEQTAADAFTLYLNRLDPSKQFLLADDVAELKRNARTMTDGMLRGDYELLNRSSEILGRRVDEVRDFYADLLNEPFDFSIDEEIITNLDSLDYATDEAALRERWRKSLKYSTLLRYVSMVESDELSTDEFHADVEKKARENVEKNIGRWLDRIQGLNREDHLSRYINAVINTFDPHTEYFPPLEKENFDISITGQLEGIGAQLREEDGYIKVVNIVPGSASWRGKELGEEDVILKVAQEGEEPVDVVGSSIDEAVEMIRGPKGTKVILTVKKPDGRIKPIEITRDVVVLEETYAKGAIIEHTKFENSYGYIDLPKFYTDFNRNGSPKAADDVRKILLEMAEEGVEGVVLDLRNNGGGSLQEAIDIAGLFIETGPVVQVQDRNGVRQVYGDVDGGEIAWSGDVVVLVNSFSASASEILAGMLQDYGRAVIVGAPSTFGKGTVQRFFDLDERVKARYSDLGPLGSVKITTQQFYRVNGASTQFDGVIPDVVLPDLFSYRAIGERSLEYALPGDTVESAEFNLWLDRPVPAERLAETSSQRVASSPLFQIITRRAGQMRDEQNRVTRSLNLQEALAEQEMLDEEAEEYEEAKPDLSYLEVETLKSDDMNETRAAMMKEFAKGIAQDIYIDEALSILHDLRVISDEHGWTYRATE